MKVNKRTENYGFDICGCFIEARFTHLCMNVRLCEIISAIYNSKRLTEHSDIIEDHKLRKLSC